MIVAKKVNFAIVFLTALVMTFCSFLPTETAKALTVDKIQTIAFEETGNSYGCANVNSALGGTLAGNTWTRGRIVSEVNGKDIDKLDDVNASYLYCVQPGVQAPTPGKDYPITDILDDNETGKKEVLRKLIYYCPGGSGYKAKTKKRWYKKYTASGGSTDMKWMAHMMLSYVYDSQVEMCKKVNKAVFDLNIKEVNYMKKWIKDLDNLPDPPEDFLTFYLKVSGHQNMYGALYVEPDVGELTLVKKSTNTSISNDNKCYSLAGAEYTVYDSDKCTEDDIVDDIETETDAILKTKADGTSNKVKLAVGTYYVKETEAAKGFALNEKVYKVTVKKDEVVTIDNATDDPEANEIEIAITRLKKVIFLGFMSKLSEPT